MRSKVFDIDLVDFSIISLLFLCKEREDLVIRLSSSGKGLHIRTEKCLCAYECFNRNRIRKIKGIEITFSRKNNFYASSWLLPKDFLQNHVNYLMHLRFVLWQEKEKQSYKRRKIQTRDLKRDSRKRKQQKKRMKN